MPHIESILLVVIILDCSVHDVIQILVDRNCSGIRCLYEKVAKGAIKRSSNVIFKTVNEGAGNALAPVLRRYSHCADVNMVLGLFGISFVFGDHVTLASACCRGIDIALLSKSREIGVIESWVKCDCKRIILNVCDGE